MLHHYCMHMFSVLMILKYVPKARTVALANQEDPVGMTIAPACGMIRNRSDEQLPRFTSIVYQSLHLVFALVK